MNKICFKKSMTCCLVAFASLCYISCSQSMFNALGDYKREVVRLKPDADNEGLRQNQYTVDSVCELSLPSGMELHEATKIVVKNGRIYVMDSEFYKTIYVFDTSGKFLFRAGERGRAKNEYIDGPADFFVDDHRCLHVFDSNAYKIIIFNDSGKVDKVVDVAYLHPEDFGMLSNKEYMFDFNINKNESNSVLVKCDKYNYVERELLQREDVYTYVASQQTFYANGDRLSHIPLLSDSVLVFKGDSLEKVVKFDFNGRFIMDEEPTLVVGKHTPKEISAYKGVRGLDYYQESENLVLLRYTYQSVCTYWLYNKKNKKSITSTALIDGFSGLYNFFVNENQIISLVFDTGEPFSKEMYDYGYNRVPEQLQRIYDGKTKLPAVIFFSVK